MSSIRLPSTAATTAAAAAAATTEDGSENILRLSDEILSKIFSCLPSEALQNAAGVCRRFYAIASDPTVQNSSFERFLAPVTRTGLQRLTENIKARDTLLVWQRLQMLLNGHEEELMDGYWNQHPLPYPQPETVEGMIETARAFPAWLTRNHDEIQELLNRQDCVFSFEGLVLSTLPEALQSLRWPFLNLEGNRFSTLPLWIKDAGVENLYLESNQFREIPSFIKNMTELKILFIGDNPLDELPDLSRLTSIKILGLEGLGIKKLPSWMSELSSLEDLRLQDNDFCEFPSELFDLHSLEEVHIGENQIQQFPETRGSLQIKGRNGQSIAGSASAAAAAAAGAGKAEEEERRPDASLNEGLAPEPPTKRTRSDRN